MISRYVYILICTGRWPNVAQPAVLCAAKKLVRRETGRSEAESFANAS